MNIIDLSIKRPVFITCVFLFSIVTGLLCFKKTNVDLFPDVKFPVISIVTRYNGAGPKEIENLISKPIEEAISAVSGIESLKSMSQDNVSIIILQLKLGTDIKYAQQQVRDKLSSIHNKLPDDLVDEPIIQVLDPNDKPVIYMAIAGDVSANELYDLADQQIKPLIEGLGGIGKVNVIGGRKREIQVLLDKNKLIASEISASQVSEALSKLGKNVPAGSYGHLGANFNVRTLGEFRSVAEIKAVPVKFYQNEVLTKVGDLGQVIDANEDETSRAFLNAKPTLILEVFKASDANTVEVAKSVTKLSVKINERFKTSVPHFTAVITKDDSEKIKKNLYDVEESIIIGLILTIIAVYGFMGNLRSTLITAIALPNSLICAFILIYGAGFTINILTLLAMSLSVGLLIDDAIVVRENIFRHIELGKTPTEAASFGAKEILLAVLATTFVIIGVFLPIAFLSGIVGQFFRQFGFTVCFIMFVSLLDALTMAPMLSAYFAGSHKTSGLVVWMDKRVTKFSNNLQNWMTSKYEKALLYTIKNPGRVLLITLIFTFGGFASIKHVPKNFIKKADTGDFIVALEMPAGTELNKTFEIAKKMDENIRLRKEVDFTLLTIGGGTTANSNTASIFVKLVEKKHRKRTTTDFRNYLEKTFVNYPELTNVGTSETDNPAGSGPSSKNTGAFILNIIGSDLDKLNEVSDRVLQKLSTHPDLKDVDTTYRIGRPEVRLVVDAAKSKMFGVTTQKIGDEIRTFVEGKVSGSFKEGDYEYNIKVRLQENQRNIEQNFKDMFVPNINEKQIRLSNVAKIEFTKSPSSVYRADRMRYVAISASVNSQGSGGINKAMLDAKAIMEQEVKNDPSLTYEFDGEAKNFAELGASIMTAMGLAMIFMYLILASLYESFRQPFMIMTILPLALCGGFYALFITQASLDLFSMIGCVMLIGVAAKNSILLVDCINEQKRHGLGMVDAILQAGKLRIRPIIMTSVVLILGMLPVAIGLNEASQQRSSMGIIVTGGLISSTLLSLIVVPALYIGLDKFKARTKIWLKLLANFCRWFCGWLVRKLRK